MKKKEKRLMQFYKEHRDALLILAGMLLVSLIALPYAVLGEGSYVEVHDQLDGEVLNYIYQAKYLFQNGPVREFLGGMGKASMLPPAPLFVLLFKFLSPFAAFACMHEIELAVAFLGMYFLGKRLKFSTEIAFIAACFFAYLPFYPVYGLSQYGQPLLLLCFILLAKGEKKIRAMAGVAFCAAFSSLSLIGYAFLGFGILASLLFLICKKKKEAAGVLQGVGILLITYIALNLDLFGSVSGKSYVTHRTQMVLRPISDMAGHFWELLFVGGSYAKVYAGFIAALGLVLTILFVLSRFGKKEAWDKYGGAFAYFAPALAIGGLLLFGTLLCVLWTCPAICALRAKIGGPFPYFQADRIYWMFPFLWMLILGYLLQSLLEYLKVCKEKKILRGTLCAAASFLLLAEAALIFRDQPLNKNMRLLLVPGYERVTWKGFYMEEVFAKIGEVIDGDKENYRVASLGIYPSIALYNGYFCADGYSNNYDLEYKERFRKIMAAELAKNEEARLYYDEWGNRVYLCAAPYGMNAFVGKGAGGSYAAPEFDLEVMKEMGIRYLFSAAEIEFSKEEESVLRLKKVEGSPFSAKDSYYAVWVYEISE